MRTKYFMSAHQFFFIVSLICIPKHLVADDLGKSKLSLSTSAGIEYDSNITVIKLESIPSYDNDDEQDLFRRSIFSTSDAAQTLAIQVGYKEKFGGKIKSNIGYNFSENFHEEQTQYDIQTHMLSGGISYSSGKSSLGLNVYRADIKLGGKNLLIIDQIKPSISFFPSRKILLRTGYDFSKKHFDGRPQRNANTHSGSMDAHYFLNNFRHYVSVGYRYRSEEATGEKYDYVSHKSKIGWNNKLTLFKKDLKLGVLYTYEKKSFSDPTAYSVPISNNGQLREDSIYKIKLISEYLWSNNMTIGLSYEYSDNDSTKELVNYTQHLTKMRLKVKF